LETLLREAETAAAAHAAAKDDAEYHSMWRAVIDILDPASNQFDGRGRMPLSTFLDRLRDVMNVAGTQHAPRSTAAAQLGPAKGGGSFALLADHTETRRRVKQQNLDGLASRHDLFHHSTSRRIVLQTAPDELVKEQANS